MSKSLLLRQMQVGRAPIASFTAMGLVWGSFAGLVPDIRQVLHLSDAALGTLLIATPIAAVLSMLAAPYVAPRFGQHVLPISVLMLAVAYAVPGWSQVAFFFALAMVAVGATNGFLDVVMNARVSAIEADHGLHLMNISHALYSFGYAGAAVATGIARAEGVSVGPIMTTAALCIAACAILTFEAGHQINGFAHVQGAKGRLGLVPILGGLIIMIAFMTEHAVEAWSALHIERTLGGARGVGSFGPAIVALTMGLGRTAGQVVIARIDQTRLMRWGTLVAAAGLMLVALAPTAPVAYGALIITGLGASVIAPTAYSMIGRLGDPDRRALIIARATALAYLGYFFGPPALGFASELFGLRAAFGGAAGVLLFVLVLVPRLLATGSQR